MNGIQDLASRLKSEADARQAERGATPLTRSDLTAGLVEIKRLATLASNVAPKKDVALTQKDLEMVADLLRRSTEIAVGLMEKVQHALSTDQSVADYKLNADDLGVMSALVNLGSAQAEAEAAVRYARAQHPEAGFEQLFKAAVMSIRKGG